MAAEADARAAEVAASITSGTDAPSPAVPGTRDVPDYTRRRYAAFIDLSGQHVAVIGGGDVATRKVDALLDHGARVTVVAPQATDRISSLARAAQITWVRRAYAPGDLRGARLAVCAAGDPRVNEAAHAEAQVENCLINVVDVPELCDFIVPAVVDRGPLQIAVSTSGAAPTVAKRIKREIAAAYDESWERYLMLLGEVRGLVMARVGGGEAVRKPLFEALAASDLHARLRAGEDIDAQCAYERYVLPLLEGGAA